MRLWWRVGLAVWLLAGFYVLAIGLVGGLIALVIVAMGSGEPWVVTAWPVLIVVEGLIVVVAVAAVLSARRRVPPPAIALGEGEAPGLWELVRTLAAGVDAEPPDLIRLTADPNAGVFEEGRFWGLRPGQRYLDIGAPLLWGMTVDQLTAVVAHELGHYSRRDTRLAGVVYRGQETMLDVLDGLPRSPWRALLHGYFRLYWAVASAVLRRQEWLADSYAAAVTGGPTMAGALRELNAIAAGWQAYLDRWVGPHRSTECVPDNISGDFRDFLAAAVVDLDGHRRDLPDGRGRWETHPPLAERVAVLERASPGTATRHPEPAAALVPDLYGVCARLDVLAFPIDGRRRVPFAEFGVAVEGARRRQDADVLYRAAGLLQPHGAGLTGVLDLLEAGHVTSLAAAVLRVRAAEYAPATAVPTLAGHIEAALSLAAVDSGAAHWSHSWRAGVELLDGEGRPFAHAEPFGIAGLAAAFAGPRSAVAPARRRLAELGVRERHGAPSNADARGEPLGLMAAVTVNGRPHDLLLHTEGLVLYPGNRYNTTLERLESLAREILPMPGLPADHWRLRYEDIVAASTRHRSPAKLTFTLRDGTLLTIEETRGAAQLPFGAELPRRLLLNVAASIEATGAPGAPGQFAGRGLATVPAQSVAAPPHPARRQQGLSRMILGAFCVVPGILLVALALANDGMEPGLLGTGIGSGVAGGALLLWGYVEFAGVRSGGVVYLVFGAVLSVVWTAAAVIAETALPLVNVAFGMLLLGLGLARQHGRWPKRQGNGWLLGSAAVLTVAVTVLVGNWQTQRRLDPDVLYPFGLAVLLLVIGAVRRVRAGRASMPTVPWYDLARADRAALYGLIALAGLVAFFPVGMVYAVLSIREARKLGRRPPVTAILAIALPVLGIVGMLVL